MALSESDKQKIEERANAYKQMFESWAWKDFMFILDGIEKAEIDSFLVDSFPMEHKGAINCVRKIKREIELIINP